jgi:hypothetical protein
VCFHSSLFIIWSSQKILNIFFRHLLTFSHRDLSGHSPPLRTTFFSLGI